MNSCAVCHAENDHLATVCTSCGGFLQRRIENLDLFSSSWQVLERPVAGFRIIALAKHKNYMVLLSAVAGFAFVFGFFWLAKAGEYAQNLINILAAGLALGPPVGIVVVLSVSWAIVVFSRFMRLRVRLRDVYAVAAYASVPLILSSILLLPIEVLSFGTYFFTRDPSPYLIRPLSYVTLLALDGAFGLWSVILLWVGLRVLFNAGWSRPAGAVLTVLLLAGLVVAAVIGVGIRGV